MPFVYESLTTTSNEETFLHDFLVVPRIPRKSCFLGIASIVISVAVFNLLSHSSVLPVCKGLYLSTTIMRQIVFLRMKTTEWSRWLQSSISFRYSLNFKAYFSPKKYLQGSGRKYLFSWSSYQYRGNISSCFSIQKTLQNY